MSSWILKILTYLIRRHPDVAYVEIFTGDDVNALLREAQEQELKGAECEA